MQCRIYLGVLGMVSHVVWSPWKGIQFSLRPWRSFKMPFLRVSLLRLSALQQMSSEKAIRYQVGSSYFQGEKIIAECVKNAAVGAADAVRSILQQTKCTSPGVHFHRLFSWGPWEPPKNMMHLVGGGKDRPPGLRRAADLLFGSTFTLSRCEDHSISQQYRVLQCAASGQQSKEVA